MTHSSFVYAILVFALYVAAQSEENSTLDNKAIMLVRMIPRTAIQLELLESLKNERQGLRIQFWRHPDKVNRYCDVWISRISLDDFRTILYQVGLKFTILSKDIVKEVGKPDIKMNNIEDYDSVYQKFDDITSEMKRLAAIYKDQMTLSVIGKSAEGREIYKTHLHQNASISKPIVFVLCGSHAREWLGIAACQYVLRRMMFDQAYDKDISDVLNDYDVVMVPLLNPDGYEFTKKSRMWRKSRSQTSDERCRGVDINRNFNYRWGGGGSSPDPCEEIYCGPKPFSESESLALARDLYKMRRKLVSFFDIHTYGQLWMSPWGFTTGFPRDYVKQEYALKAIQKAIKEKNGMTYKIGRSATTLYATSGDAIDWVYGTLGVVHTYGIELRPTIKANRNGFKLSRKQIIPTGKDLFIGLTTMAVHMTNEENTRY